MSDSLKDAVKRQFGAHAANYVTSSIHAKGGDLGLLPELAGLNGTQDVLDIATATGHTALALAPHTRRVIGVDLTVEMLTEARRQAELQGVSNVTFTEADAEQLPFPDGSFDVVTCRIAAHHFPQVEAFCREASRVLRPGGVLLIVDNVAPEDEEQDRFINALEKLRDPSHFREHRLSEWERYLAGAGLRFSVPHRFETKVELEGWMQRVSVPEPVAAEIRQRLATAPAPVREVFRISDAGFVLHKAIIAGRKPA